MSQVTRGLRKILSASIIYNVFQDFVGSRKLYKIYVSEYLQPADYSCILDVGCGTSEILDFLPPAIEYHGYDLSREYIQSAVKKYGSRGYWRCSSVSDMEVNKTGSFDIVMANGVLHHLDDQEVRRLAAAASLALKPGGRFCSFDGCFIDGDGQNPIARYLISQDRGKNVRKPTSYKSLVSPYFKTVDLIIRHDMLRIPYTHAIMVATI